MDQLSLLFLSVCDVVYSYLIIYLLCTRLHSLPKTTIREEIGGWVLNESKKLRTFSTKILTTTVVSKTNNNKQTNNTNQNKRKEKRTIKLYLIGPFRKTYSVHLALSAMFASYIKCNWNFAIHVESFVVNYQWLSWPNYEVFLCLLFRKTVILLLWGFWKEIHTFQFPLPKSIA